MTTATIADDERLLLASIIAEHDQDAPRLVYADWLEEHGEVEQANFIRSHLGQGSADVLPKEQLNALEHAWLKRIGIEDCVPTFQRGFARLKALQLWDHHEASLEAWIAFFSSPHLASLQRLSVENCDLRDNHVIALVRSPALANLQWLDLSYNSVSMGACQALRESPFMANLRSLFLRENSQFSYEGLEACRRRLEERFGAKVLRAFSPTS